LAYGYYKKLTQNPMLEVKPSSQRGTLTTGSGQNSFYPDKFMSPLSP